MLFALNGKLTNHVITVSTGKIVLGAMSAGTNNYGTYNVTVPDGYKTTGVATVKHEHPYGGSGFYAQASIPADSTGVVSGFYVYGAIVSIASDRSDISILVECVKS